MAIETTIFTFQISVPYSQWLSGFDSEQISKLHEENGINPLYRGVSLDDPQKIVVIHQAEEGVTRAFFEASREDIEASGHIWESTEITTWKA